MIYMNEYEYFENMKLKQKPLVRFSVDDLFDLCYFLQLDHTQVYDELVNKIDTLREEKNQGKNED
jgi:hypothetical protein